MDRYVVPSNKHKQNRCSVFVLCAIAGGCLATVGEINRQSTHIGARCNSQQVRIARVCFQWKHQIVNKIRLYYFQWQHCGII